MPASEVLEIADELYALPMGEFTPARDARAKALKAAGDADQGLVKSLKKPTVAAWVVNLLVRREPDQVEQLLDVGAALREAATSLDAEQLRALTRQRRQLTAAVTTTARGHAREAGLKVTPAVADQVEATLTAAMLDAEAARAVRSGLLVQALTAVGVGGVDAGSAVACPAALGFQASAVAASVPGPATLHVVPDLEPHEADLDQAREELSEAEASHERALTIHEGTTAAVESLEARALELASQLEELRRQIAEIEDEAEEVDDELSDAELARIESQRALDEAQTAREQAAKRLSSLEG